MEKKIAFIICSNDDMWYEECVKYLAHLEAPEGFELDVIKVTNAVSMAAGYNEGMHASDAKYKIYMHHDVFILCKDFLKRVVQVFREHSEIGIMGVLGANQIVQHANYWNNWDCGQVYSFNVVRKACINLKNDTGASYAPAMAVDGMILMTQYDIPWREDLFTKWDFYDISQCFEFQRNGYKVAVLLEQAVSVAHDCGFSKLENYDEERAIFCVEYKEYGFEYGGVSAVNIEEVKQVTDKFLQTFDMVMQMNVDSVIELVDKIYQAKFANTTIAILKLLCMIYSKEKEAGVCSSIMEKGDTWKELVKKYTKYKFLIRAAELGITTDAKEQLREAIESGKLSAIGIEMIGYGATCDWKYFEQTVLKDIVR